MDEDTGEKEPPGSRKRGAFRQSAARQYRQALSEAPQATDAEFLLSVLSYDQEVEAARQAASRGDGPTLMRRLKQAASSPLHGGGNMMYADRLAVQGRLREAMGELERAIVKSPRSADAHVKLALLASTMREYEKARRALDAAHSLRPDRPPLYRDAVRWIERPDGGRNR